VVLVANTAHLRKIVVFKAKSLFSHFGELHGLE
jgi:hypothetical protein